MLIMMLLQLLPLLLLLLLLMLLLLQQMTEIYTKCVRPFFAVQQIYSWID